MFLILATFVACYKKRICFKLQNLKKYNNLFEQKLNIFFLHIIKKFVSLKIESWYYKVNLYTYS